MKAIVWAIPISLTFLATLAAPAQDANGGVPTATSDQQPKGIVRKREPDSLSASELLGTVVIGAGGQRVGTVRDILLDRSGRVFAVTLDVGDFLGIATKTVALSVGSLRFVPKGPWSLKGTAGNAADPTSESRSVFVPGIGMVDHIEVGLTRQQLEDAPAFGG